MEARILHAGVFVVESSMTTSGSRRRSRSKRVGSGLHGEPRATTALEGPGERRAGGGRSDRGPAWPEWIVFHVPHASRRIPAEAREAFLLDDAALRAELDRLTDHAVDVLFVPPGAAAATVAADVSRFVVDVERFVESDREPMARVGMGAIYTRATDGRPLRRALTPEEERRLLEEYYHPHHRRLADAVDGALARHGRALVLDVHSFPDVALPCDRDQAPDRPDLCIGTDAWHTPAALVDALVARASEAGFAVEVDRPYAGTMVPAAHHGRDPRVASVMVEVNRRLYLAEGTVRMAADAEDVGATVRRVVLAAVADWAGATPGGVASR